MQQTRATRRLRLRLLLAVFACIVVIHRAAAALEPATPLASVSLQNWTLENGLPQNTITALYSSPDGFLWAGTELGLARFDGSSFFTLSPSTSQNFPDAEVRTLLAISARDHTPALRGIPLRGMWIGTSDGLALWRDGRLVRFVARDGLLGTQIRALASPTPDQLWLWTDSGLAATEDGRSFHAVALPGSVGEITAVFAHDHALWVATTHALLRRQADRWQTIVTSASPLLVAPPQSDSAPVLFVNVTSAERLDGTRSTLIADRSQIPDDGVQRMTTLAGDIVALASADQLVLLRPHAPGDPGSGPRVVGRFRCGATSSLTGLPGTRIETLFADREGALWIGTNHGLARWFHNRMEPMPASHPLAREAVVSILEDREGSIWLGTETGGLYTLRDTRFHFLDESDGLAASDTTAIVETTDHNLWVGTHEQGLDQISAQISPQTGPLISSSTPLHSHPFTTGNGLPSNVILALAAARDGSVWVGTPDGLSHIHGHSLTTITAADNLPDNFIRSVYVADNQNVWIGTRHGLSCLNPSLNPSLDATSEPTGSDAHPTDARIPDARIQTWITVNGLGSDIIGAMTEDQAGMLWVATFNGLARLHPTPEGCAVRGPIQNFSTRDGLSGNIVTALAADQNRLWVGTEDHGLNLWNGKRFLAAPAALQKLLPETIHGLAVDAEGFLWMTSDDGIFRARASELAEHIENPNPSQKTAPGPSIGHMIDHFTVSDGLRSRAMSSNSHPTVLRASDGRLWFTTPRGLVVVNPRHFTPLPPSPPVAIERFAVDDIAQPIRTDAPDIISAGHLRFEFDYAGLSFSMPQRVEYEYKLEGFDRTWTRAGNRRSAYYTNIPHGHYRFLVRAHMGDASDGSPWTETQLAFILRPHYYQTVWFYVALALALAGILLLIIRWRLYLARRRFDAVMAERNRIAREIHDTLAQGYVGVSMQLEVLGELLRRQRIDAATSLLQRLQQLVREGLDDARRSIWALRSHDSSEQTLPVRLRRLAEDSADSALQTTVDIHGTVRKLDPRAEEELLRIAQEAILNVRKHAHAEHLALRLEYDESTVVLSVTDDGVGLPDTLRTSTPESPAGHYGLTGMRERAAVIGATLEISSSNGTSNGTSQGTSIRITLPVAGMSRQTESGRIPEGEDS